MTPRNTGQDARKTMQTLQALRRAAKDLGTMKQNHQETASLLFNILAGTRELLDTYGEEEGLRKLAKACPKLLDMTAEFRVVAQQISVTVDDLQALLTSRLWPK